MDEEKRNHYEAVLADLLTRRRELDATIAVLRRALGQAAPAEAAGESPAPEAGEAALADELRSDTFFGMSIADAARKYLRLRRRKQTTVQIAAALERGGLTHASENFIATASSVLSREARRGSDIVRVARGEWGLAEWYPGLRQKRPLPAPPHEGGDLGGGAPEDERGEGDLPNFPLNFGE